MGIPITYKYSLKNDIHAMYQALRDRRWFKEEGLAYFLPNPLRTIKLWLKKPKGPAITAEFPVTCYWVSAGTWGAYTPPNTIFICPYKNPNIAKVIRHELTHLEHYHETKDMTHEEKEKYINRKEKEKYVYGESSGWDMQ